MGAGKSTFGNALLETTSFRNNTELKKDQNFKAKRSSTGITQNFEMQEFDDLIIIDSPGVNDA